MISRTPPARREVLRAAALAALAAPLASLASACTTGYEDAPDPLLPLLAAARADAEAARKLAGSAGEDLAGQVATVRSAQAEALQREVDRLNRPAPEQAPPAPPTTVDGVEALGRRLADARKAAADLVGGLPTYRAGLVGSVAAGCAAVQQLAPALGAEQPGAVTRPSTGELTEEAVAALQDALATEHAAVWVYELVTAFLSADYQRGLDDGAAAHRDRRDAAEHVLEAAGATPRSQQAAYVPPEPVTDGHSAEALVVTAEADAAEAWRGVLGRTEDRGLRTLATQALVGAASRGTSWRIETGRTPPALPLPGAP